MGSEDEMTHFSGAGVGELEPPTHLGEAAHLHANTQSPSALLENGSTRPFFGMLSKHARRPAPFGQVRLLLGRRCPASS